MSFLGVVKWRCFRCRSRQLQQAATTGVEEEEEEEEEEVAVEEKA